MNCSKCGAPLEDDARFCAVCGTPVEAAAAPAPAPAVTETYSGGQGGYAPGGAGAQGGYVPGGAGSQGGYVPGGAGTTQGGYAPGGAGATQGGYAPGGAGTQGGYVPGSAGATQGGYVPGSAGTTQGGYVPGGAGTTQGGYAPGGAGTQSNYLQEGAQGIKNALGGFASKLQSNIPSGKGGGGKSEPAASMNKTVRRYFLGGAPKWTTIMIIIGIPLLFVGVGIFVILLGLLIKLIYRFIPNFRGEEASDRAWAEQEAILKQRGLEKLNVIGEQVSLIDPVYVVGMGISPDESFEIAQAQTAVKNKAKGLFGNLFGFLKKQTGTEGDPVEAYKFGSDDRVRAMLMELTVFMFTDSQVLVYCADVDISTGLIYREYTSECFYQDIEGMNFTQSLYKVFNVKKKKYLNRTNEVMELFFGGCTLKTSINMEVNASMIDNQFMAMRNLIRDKKNG